MEWKEQAEKLFFKEGKPLGKAAEECGVSRQALSSYMKTLPEYRKEKERRKEANSIRRKEYKREKNREYRSCMEVTGETLKREHEIAVAILLHEKYH